MKSFRKLVVFFCLFAFSALSAQTLSVESFRLLENDLTANTRGTMKFDQNGDVAALIKIVTTENDFNFDVGSMGVVATSQQKGEIWVYVPGGVQRITITHARLGVLRNYFFPVPIEKARTYELILFTGTVRTIVEQAQTSQFVVFKVQPSNAVVYVDEELRSLDEDGLLSLRLLMGNHSYRVMAPSFVTESGAIEVKDEKITKEISLVSAKATLYVATASDASIWINEKEVGRGSWNGQLEAGVYLIEARKPSHRTVSQEVILSQQEIKKINITAPEPQYGSLEIYGTPIECDYYLDGNKIGTTPDLKEKILIGAHEVEIRKNGYDAQKYDITIQEGEVYQIDYSIEKPIYTYGSLQIKTKPKYSYVKVDNEFVGMTPLTLQQITSGSHAINIYLNGYKDFNGNITIKENKKKRMRTTLASEKETYDEGSFFEDDESLILSLPLGYEFGGTKAFSMGLGLYRNRIFSDIWVTFPKIYEYYYESNSDLRISITETNVLMLGADVGYCLNPEWKLLVAPKMGCSYTAIPSVQNSGSWYYNAGCRFQLPIVYGLFGLFIIPEYRFGGNKSIICNLDGFHMKLGVNINLPLD